MKVQKRGEVSRELMTRCLKIMMMLCFMVSAEDVISQSYYGSASSFQQTSSFSSTSSLIKPKNNYSPASMRSATTVSARGLYTSTRGLRTTSAKMLHSSVAGGEYTLNKSVTHSGTNTGNTFAAASFAAPATSRRNYSYAGSKTTLTKPMVTGGTFGRGTMTDRTIAPNTTTYAMATAISVPMDSRRYAPPTGGGGEGAIINSFINWLNQYDSEHNEHHTTHGGWAYDDEPYWYYNMDVLEELWNQYCAEKNLPGTYNWEVFLRWFFSYDPTSKYYDPSLNQNQYRAPIGDGMWIMMALAAAYVICRRFTNKTTNEHHSKTNESA